MRKKAVTVEVVRADRIAYPWTEFSSIAVLPLRGYAPSRGVRASYIYLDRVGFHWHSRRVILHLVGHAQNNDCLS